MVRLAHSLVALRDQVNAKFPTRSKLSDGWIGDAAHNARLSQHNPNSAGVVCAIDITEDLSVGLDCNRLMAELDASNDDRIFYLIHDGMIDNSNDVTTPYTGANKHTKHMHISVKWDQPDKYDNGRAWAIPMLTIVPEGEKPPKPGPVSTQRPTVRKGDNNAHVAALQARLNRDYSAYSRLTVDGDFGPATDAVVREFQRRAGLVVDGVVGPKTWAKLGL